MPRLYHSFPPLTIPEDPGLEFTTLNNFLPPVDTAGRPFGLFCACCATTRGDWHEVEEKQALRRQHSLTAIPDARARRRAARVDAHLRQLPTRQIDSTRQKSRSADSSRLPVRPLDFG